MIKVKDRRWSCYCDEVDNFKISFTEYQCSVIRREMSYWIMKTCYTWEKKTKEVGESWVYGWAEGIPEWCKSKCHSANIRGFELKTSKVSAARDQLAHSRFNLKWEGEEEFKEMHVKKIAALQRYINRYKGKAS